MAYFVVFSLGGGGNFVRRETRVTEDGGGGTRIGTTVAGREVGSTTLGRSAADSAASARPRATAPDTGSFLQRRAARLQSLGQEEQDRLLRDAVGRHLPKAFFALVPLLALILRALYRRSGHHYAEHLIFALHYQAFAFAAFAVSDLADLATTSERIESIVTGAIYLALLGYLYLALRRVYRQSYGRTAVKLALLLPTYGVVFALVMIVVFFGSLFMI